MVVEYIVTIIARLLINIIQIWHLGECNINFYCTLKNDIARGACVLENDIAPQYHFCKVVMWPWSDQSQQRMSSRHIIRLDIACPLASTDSSCGRAGPLSLPVSPKGSTLINNWTTKNVLSRVYLSFFQKMQRSNLDSIQAVWLGRQIVIKCRSMT